MPILLAHIGTLVDEDTGSKLVVGLGGKEERGGSFVVQHIHVGTKGQQHLQHISGSTQAGSIVQGTEPTHQTAGSYIHTELPQHSAHWCTHWNRRGCSRSIAPTISSMTMHSFAGSSYLPSEPVMFNFLIKPMLDYVMTSLMDWLVTGQRPKLKLLCPFSSLELLY